MLYSVEAIEFVKVQNIVITSDCVLHTHTAAYVTLYAHIGLYAAVVRINVAHVTLYAAYVTLCCSC